MAATSTGYLSQILRRLGNMDASNASMLSAFQGMSTSMTNSDVAKMAEMDDIEGKLDNIQTKLDLSNSLLADIKGNTAAPNVNKTLVGATSGNVGNAIATATIAAVSGKTNYLSSVHVTGSGSLVGLPVIVTITGLDVGTIRYSYAAIAGALLTNIPLLVDYPEPLKASAPNTAIVVTCPALGLGNANNIVNAFGYRS